MTIGKATGISGAKPYNLAVRVKAINVLIGLDFFIKNLENNGKELAQDLYSLAKQGNKKLLIGLNQDFKW